MTRRFVVGLLAIGFVVWPGGFLRAGWSPLEISITPIGAHEGAAEHCYDQLRGLLGANLDSLGERLEDLSPESAANLLGLTEAEMASQLYTLPDEQLVEALDRPDVVDGSFLVACDPEGRTLRVVAVFVQGHVVRLSLNDVVLDEQLVNEVGRYLRDVAEMYNPI